MKNKSLLSFPLLAALLSSCSFQGSTDHSKEAVSALSVYTISDINGDIRVVLDEGSGLLGVDPFQTVISGSLYYYQGDYTEEQLQAIKDEFSYDFQFYSALSDRHYDYTMDGDAKTPIVNVKTINDTPRGTPIEVDPFLFDILQESYEFSLETADENGNLRFDIFTGHLNQYYEDKLTDANRPDTKNALDYTLQYANGLLFSTDCDMEELDSIIASTPVTKEEAEGLLEFDAEKHTVTFNSLVKNGRTIDDVELSLSAVGKGFATERITEKLQSEYPDISLVINSGTSSIKTVGERPDGKNWNIRLENPVFGETNDTVGINPYETGLSVSGQFNMSTSGYYQHYFYVFDLNQDEYIRRDHIINPSTGLSTSYFDTVSIFNQDTGLADMYTTTLMLTSSIEEAVSLLNHLDAVYGQKSEMILTFKSQKGSPLTHYAYRNSELTNRTPEGYPTAWLQDGTTYTGDYTDISGEDIRGSLSKAERDFGETYWITSGLSSSFFLLEGDDLSNPGSSRAVIVKEND